MFTHDTYKRVRYAETDKMGYMYYGHYAALYEIGRVEMMRELGVPYKMFEDDKKIMLPVVHVDARYLMPAYYDDLLCIRTTVNELPSKMITIHTDILNEQQQTIHKAIVKLFFIDMTTNRKISAPDFFTDVLQPHFI